ncbi:peptidylprolyl isomerase [Roseovarius sp. D22-M7]|uniref:peptidylprolyl isomerase n=1 Tax=Roseovarius sp. D22-M7 TaxID=3127116 RepID=UPI00300FDEEF
MLCRFLASTAMIAALSFAAPARAQDDPSADTVVATVGETEITLGHMLALRGTLPEQYDRVPPDVLFDGVLDQLVQQTLLMQTQEGPLSRAARVRLDNDRRAVLAADVAKGIFETRITDEAVRALYESRYAEAETGPEYRAAHILVETEEEALAIIDKIEGGANFAALAQQHSIGPSGPSGGDLGWFGEGVMVPEFFDAVAALGDGGISAPLETGFGWHVIELRETRIRERPTLAEVRGDLAAELRQKAFDDHVAQLERESDVSRAGAEGVAPALINRIDLLED